MLADTILILFISMATALLSEGKYLLLIKSESGLLCTQFSAYYLMRHVLIESWSKIMIVVHVKCPHELLICC